VDTDCGMVECRTRVVASIRPASTGNATSATGCTACYTVRIPGSATSTKTALAVTLASP